MQRQQTAEQRQANRNLERLLVSVVGSFQNPRRRP